MSVRSATDECRFLNRELSWLAFNQRVLAEAANPAVPLVERLKFAAIAASNLEEFFMVRVARLRRAVNDGEDPPDVAGLTPAQQLALVRERTHGFMLHLQSLVTTELLPTLESHGIGLRRETEIRAAERGALLAFFREAVLPVLTPLAIDTSRPFPLLSSLTVNLVLLLEPGPGEAQPRLAVVQVPAGLSRLVRVPSGEGIVMVLLEDLMRTHIALLFPGQDIREVRVLRLTRDAELDLDEEGGPSHLERVERELRRRRRSDVIRVEVDAAASDELLGLLIERLDVSEDEVERVEGPMDWRLLMELADLPGFEHLRDPPLVPVTPLQEHEQDMFSLLDTRDLLLHHPYESFDPVLAFVAQAAEDPGVLAIKQTLYRSGTESPLIASLRRAAERNKQVTVIVEVTARFDEERNIHWARTLEEAGAHVIYGVRGLKTHAKMCLVVRRTSQGLRRYLHLGTGNYNARTARLYTDFSLMTSASDLCEDASAVFNTLTGYSDPPRLKVLWMAPTTLRQQLVRLIRREQRRAEAGHPAAITAKMNALLDEQIIDALYAAGRAGVRVRLNVRGICGLRPGAAGSGGQIDVISIVDRFLEHSRVYVFGTGGDESVYLGSADWMTRNLNRRVEVVFPIRSPELKRTVVAAVESMFRDNVKAWRLRSDGTYERVTPDRSELPFRVQEHLLRETRTTRATREKAEGLFLPH